MVMKNVKRRTTLILVLAASLLAGAAAGVWAYAPFRSSISFSGDVPGDVRAVATDTWDRFVDAFPARHECLQSVRLTVAWTHPDRAAYDPDRKLVTLRVPGTSPNLGATLTHEYAHHLEFTCMRGTDPLFDFKAAFLAAQGFPPGAPWFEGASWETTPSEQFAEAVTQVVTGRPPLHQRVVLTEEALDLIRAWARTTPARLNHQT